ncbi:PPC domain-containing protein [Pseudoalteromonas xiamenensis]|uniref:PPC domain-containing protein n=1 Tax=Pseudoalteromonas xiamenensis TaxID=882626 RepID=A0A975DEG8_9GAMM|nr:PPC domain-containing protein [Pseudoalteromonas xiamenensis]
MIQTRDGTSGDADLHVKFGREATRTDYDYRPWKAGSNETVSIAAPQAGRWHIMVSPYSNQAMTEVKLTASWTETGGDNGSTTIDNVCTAQNPVSSGKLTPDNTICLDGSRTVYLSIWVPTGKSTLTLIGGHGTGDMTLYYKAGAWPSASSYDNLSTASGSNNDSITITNPSSGWHYLMVTGQHSGAALLTKFN